MNPRAEKLELLDQQGGVFELTAALTTIGRASSNMVVVPNQYVSRKHAEVHFDGRGYILVDLGSGHGTVLNGQTLRPHQPCVLHPGDKLVLANQVSFSLRRSAIASGPSSPGAWAQAPWRHAVPQQFGDISGQLDLVLAGLGCSIVILAFFTNWIRAGSPFADAFLGLGDLVSYEMSGLKMLVGFPDLGFPGSPVVLLVPLLAAGALALCLWRRSTTSKSARISAIVQMVLAVLGIAYMFGLLYVSKALVASAIEQTGLPGVLGDKLISFQPSVGFWLTCLGFILVIAGAFWSLRRGPYPSSGLPSGTAPAAPQAQPTTQGLSFTPIRDFLSAAFESMRKLPPLYLKLAGGVVLAVIVVVAAVSLLPGVVPWPDSRSRMPESGSRAHEVPQQPAPIEPTSEAGVPPGQAAGASDPEPRQAEQVSFGSAEPIQEPEKPPKVEGDADEEFESGQARPAKGRVEGPPPCRIALQDSFRRLSNVDWSVLGCPTTPASSGIWMAKEGFQAGQMFWRDDNEEIYARHAAGHWERFVNQWYEGQPEFSCPALGSTSPPVPKRGFGKIWCENPVTRDQLGWALNEESGFYGTVQDFETGGHIIQTDTGRTYVFYPTGAWVER